MTEATAKFPADFVLGRALELIEKNEKEMGAARTAAIQELESKPTKRGFLFWRHEHYRTRAEAEAEYFGNDGHTHYFETLAYETERKFDRHIFALQPLRRLAGAAMLHSQDATVTLTAGNCATLDIPLESGK